MPGKFHTEKIAQRGRYILMLSQRKWKKTQNECLTFASMVFLTRQPETGVKVSKHVFVLPCFPDIVDCIGQLLCHH